MAAAAASKDAKMAAQQVMRSWRISWAIVRACIHRRQILNWFWNLFQSLWIPVIPSRNFCVCVLCQHKPIKLPFARILSCSDLYISIIYCRSADKNASFATHAPICLLVSTHSKLKRTSIGFCFPFLTSKGTWNSNSLPTFCPHGGALHGLIVNCSANFTICRDPTIFSSRLQPAPIHAGGGRVQTTIEITNCVRFLWGRVLGVRYNRLKGPMEAPTSVSQDQLLPGWMYMTFKQQSNPFLWTNWSILV